MQTDTIRNLVEGINNNEKNLLDLLQPLQEFNRNFPQNYSPQHSEILEKVSALFNKTVADIPIKERTLYKPLLQAINLLEIHVITTHPKISPSWNPLISLLNQTNQSLQIDLDAVPSAKDGTKKMAKRRKNRNKNRYSNVFPYDKNRYKLPNEEYIEVSDFKLNGNRYLVGSAPLDHTITDWWHMVIDSGSRLIAVTTNTSETKYVDGIPIPFEKSIYYWKEEDTINDALIEGWSCISLSDKEVLGQTGFQKIIKRIITLKGPDEIREIAHLHFLNWPDSGIADIQLMFKFQDIIQKYGENPIVLHCSAGIGRTGTTLAIREIMKKVQASQNPKELSIDVMSEIKTLRQHRAGLVQSAPQVKMIALATLKMLLQKTSETNL